jgi:hypothetical protein
MQYEFTWRNKFLTTEVKTIGEMAQTLEGAAQQLRDMEQDGVTLDPDSDMADDYAMLVTDDPEVAHKYGFEEEVEEEDEEEVEEEDK